MHGHWGVWSTHIKRRSPIPFLSFFSFFPSLFLSFFLFLLATAESDCFDSFSALGKRDREADMKEHWSSSLICSFTSVVFVVPSLCPILPCALFNRQHIGRVCQMFLERDLERRRWKVVQSACAILFFYSRILYTRSNVSQCSQHLKRYAGRSSIDLFIPFTGVLSIHQPERSV